MFKGIFLFAVIAVFIDGVHSITAAQEFRNLEHTEFGNQRLFRPNSYIATIDGEKIYPRSFAEIDDDHTDVVFDENGVAYPVKRNERISGGFGSLRADRLKYGGLGSDDE